LTFARRSFMVPVNDTSPFQHETSFPRERVRSPGGDWLCRGEPPPEVYFPAEEQREDRLATGLFPFVPLPPRSEQRGFFLP
jgi:hypothetical protein